MDSNKIQVDQVFRYISNNTYSNNTNTYITMPGDSRRSGIRIGEMEIDTDLINYYMIEPNGSS